MININYSQAFEKLLEFSNLSRLKLAQELTKIEGKDVQALKNSPLNSEDDLIRLIHSVYAWMPTMIRSFWEIENFDEIKLDSLLTKVIKAREDDISTTDEIAMFKSLALLTKNHMVGASKALMIINPNKYAIFDSRVINSWNKFRQQYPQYTFEKLHNYQVNKKNSKAEEIYKYYVSTLQKWRNNCKDCCLRDIEYLLYYAGKN